MLYLIFVIRIKKISIVLSHTFGETLGSIEQWIKASWVTVNIGDQIQWGCDNCGWWGISGIVGNRITWGEISLEDSIITDLLCRDGPSAGFTAHRLLFILWCKCTIIYTPWWRHQMETSSTLLAICAGNSSVTGEFPTQRPVTWGFDVSFDLRLNKRLSKQWFEMPSHPLWHHCIVLASCAEMALQLASPHIDCCLSCSVDSQSFTYSSLVIHIFIC